MSRGEAPSEETLAAAAKEAENLARADEKPEEIPGPFGNNFILLFIAMRQVQTNPQAPSVTTYLRKTEALGQPWQDFLAQNESLLIEMDSALAEYEIILNIEALRRQLFIAREFDREEKFNKQFHSELGANAIAIPIYAKLNPLLERAAAALQQLGVDPLELELLPETAK